MMVWWWWWCVGTPGPVKNCLFICSTGFINGSPTAHQSDLGLVPWILAIKGGHRYVYKDSFQGDTKDMAWARGRRWGSISHLILSLGRIKDSP